MARDVRRRGAAAAADDAARPARPRARRTRRSTRGSRGRRSGPSTNCGSPAFGIAETGVPPAAATICSSTSSVGCGPTPQLTPTTSAPAWLQRAHRQRGRVAVERLAVQRRTSSARSPAASSETAAHGAQRGEDLVQVLEGLEDEARRSRPRAGPRPWRGTQRSASADRDLPERLERLAERARSSRPRRRLTPTISRARARHLDALAGDAGATSSSSPWRARRTALAPKVLVSISSAPAAR